MRFQIEHRIGVQAPAEQVWRHLANLESWGAWNAVHPKIDGRLQIGATLALREHTPGEPPEQLIATLVDWVPEAQIVWTLKGARGLLTRTRYLEIQSLDQEGCVFSNGEMYQGWAARYMPRRVRRARREGFTQVGEALKAKVEAEWSRSRRGVAA